MEANDYSLRPQHFTWNHEPMIAPPKRKIGHHLLAMFDDRRGVAAIEFAMLLPVMLVMYFGMEEFSTGLSVSRQVTLVARTLSDLTSQSTSVADTDLINFGETAKAILTPNDPSILRSSVTEIYIDPKTHLARVQWSKGMSIDTSGNVTVGPSSHPTSQVVPVPPELNIDGTYVIWSEVSYNYKPTVGHVMIKTGVNLSDFAYTRPRQTACVVYPTPAPNTARPACPDV
jgi:Flp pilus assembly protein TadG